MWECGTSQFTKAQIAAEIEQAELNLSNTNSGDAVSSSGASDHASTHHVNPLHVLFGFLIACFNSTQARVNGELGHLLGNGIVAAMVSFLTGWFILILIVLFSSRVRQALFTVPSLIRSGQLKWWQIIGGCAGAFYVIGQGTAVPVVGVAIFVIATVAGQSVSSLLVDKVGLGPAGPKAITALRVAAAAVAVGGVAVSVMGRDQTGHFSLPLVIYAFIVGGLTSAQHALNGRVAVATTHPMASTTVNFTMGTSTLFVVLMLMHFVGGKHLPMPPAPWERPLLWTGGIIGVLFIVSAAVLVRSLGVLVFSLVSVVGQLSGAVLLDVFFPTPGNRVTAQVVLGVAITGVAIAMAASSGLRGKLKTAS